MLNWQIFIAATFAVTVALTIRYIGRPPARIVFPILLATMWIIWTYTFVSSRHVSIIQYVTILICVAFSVLYFKKNRDRKNISSALRDVPSELRLIAEQSVRRGTAETIRGRAHIDLLRKSLQSSRQLLVIISGWISDRVIDRQFEDDLVEAMRRGSSIYIGYGWMPSAGPRHVPVSERRALDVLARAKDRAAAARAGGRLVVARIETHAKLLIVDDLYAVCGSYNWLSNRGLRNSEHSWKFDDRAFVAAERRMALDMILQGDIVPLGRPRDTEF